MAQGERFLAQGNIAVARQFFQRAAEAGLAAAALRLAATYDPAELVAPAGAGRRPRPRRGPQVVRARPRARRPEAEERLARLGGS